MPFLPPLAVDTVLYLHLPYYSASPGTAAYNVNGIMKRIRNPTDNRHVGLDLHYFAYPEAHMIRTSMLLWHDVLIVGIIGMHVTITVYVINQQGFFFTGLNLPIGG